ncbi:protein of unknown function [Methylorubrum extorquens]|uniref:Uncharacterized protein n=1 Tax=Methylorubrum extorquens TaxID=408 RepID=A0A2N9AMU8_METEX|nr:hypothetical protein B2G69_25475 [Methylorubrum zatmanii]SOR28687.1 protein of unknown function [Methylorubrum extorquens]
MDRSTTLIARSRLRPTVAILPRRRHDALIHLKAIAAGPVIIASRESWAGAGKACSSPGAPESGPSRRDQTGVLALDQSGCGSVRHSPGGVRHRSRPCRSRRPSPSRASATSSSA